MTSPILNPQPTPCVAQIEFDWTLKHHRPWLRVAEVQRALKCTEPHVRNLIDDGSLDLVIDLRGPGTVQPYYRIARDSLFRFTAQEQAPTSLESFLEPYLRNLPMVLSAWQVAGHLAVSDDHILALAAELGSDISTAGSQRTCLRVPRPRLVEFLRRRKI